MSALADYVSQLNKESTTLEDSWLSRLRFIDESRQTDKSNPEIVLLSTIPDASVNARPSLASKTEQLSSHVAIPEQALGLAQEPIDEKPTEQHAAALMTLKELVDQWDKNVTPEELQAFGMPKPPMAVPPSPMADQQPGGPMQSPDSIDGTAKRDFETLISEITDLETRVQSELSRLTPAVFPASSQTPPITDELNLRPLSPSPADSRPIDSANSQPLHEEQDDMTIDWSEVKTEPLEDLPKTATATTPPQPKQAITEQPSSRFDYRHVPKKRSLDVLVDRMVERFPATAPSVIMFLSVNGETDVDGAAAQIATCLVERDLGSTCLVDGHLDSRVLSKQLALKDQPGLVELLAQTTPLNDHCCTTDNKNLTMLPAGQGDLTFRKLSQTCLSRLSQELRQSAHYTIVSGGRFDTPLSRAWASKVDAVYLLVDMERTDRQIAIDTVEHLIGQGIRVAGCIATQ